VTPETDAHTSRVADVLVIGGGPAGSAVALALARRGMRVVVTTRAAPTAPSVGEVLPPGVRPALAQLGLWEAFARDGHLPSAGVTAWWGSGEPREWDYVRGPYGDGWHVDRARFEEMLAGAARGAGAVFVPSARVLDLTRPSARERWLVRVREPNRDRTWRADFVVLATGRSGRLPGLGVSRRRLDQLTGLARHFALPPAAPALEPRLWVEAAPDGWWYSAPLPHRRVVAVFLTDADLVGRSAGRSFVEGLSEAPQTARRLAGCAPLSPVRVVAAFASRLTCFAGSGFLAVGDAAYSVDPISGGGLVKALRSAHEAAEAVTAGPARTDEALAAYAGRWEAEYTRYVNGWADQYGLETRWPAAPFWRRRQPAGYDRVPVSGNEPVGARPAVRRT
jgi:flavin-dependent dehydrogenase